MEDAEYLEIKDRAWEKFRTIPGVHAVGLGLKTVGGHRTSDRAIIVFVVHKRRRDQLSLTELIPSTFEGIRTDVVEMGEPRSMQADAIEAEVDPNPSGPGIRVHLSALNDPVPGGWIVVLVVTVSKIPSGSSAPTSNASVVSTDPVFPSSVSDVAEDLAKGLAIDPGFKVTHQPTSADIIIVAEANFSIVVDCYVRLVDHADYSNTSGGYLRGGICLQTYSGGIGTLGCLATIPPTPKDPGGKVVAITNQHVVSSAGRDPTNLKAIVDTTSAAIQIAGTVDAEALIIVEFRRDHRPFAVAACHTLRNLTLSDTAKDVASAINNAAIDTPAGMVHASAAGTLVTVKNANGPGLSMTSVAFGRTRPAPNVRLKARLLDIPVQAPLSHILRFEGFSDERCGLHLQVTQGGALTASFSVFLKPGQMTTEQIAQHISTTINKMPVGETGQVWATAVGAELRIHKADAVECVIQSSTSVGHPNPMYVKVCSNLIGNVIDARLDVDAALIQLEAGLDYKPVIEGIGPVDGDFPSTSLFEGLPVQKRGYVSGLTTGEVIALWVTGTIRTKEGFRRFYRNVIMVGSTTREPKHGTWRPFLLSGDSGSALVTAGPRPVKVVGLLFASDSTGMIAFASPIGKVLEVFKGFGLSLALAPGQDPNAVRTVPDSAVAMSALPDGAIPRGLVGRRRPAATVGWSVLVDRLSRAREELASTSAGRECVEVIGRHFRETQALVTTNRRVGTVWQRSGGPEITNALLEMACGRDRRVPTNINGKPFADCLLRLQRVLTRYASPSLSRDLARYTPLFARWSGMTYPELLISFQTAPTE